MKDTSLLVSRNPGKESLLVNGSVPFLGLNCISQISEPLGFVFYLSEFLIGFLGFVSGHPMAASSVTSPLCTWLVAACMSVGCEKEHSLKPSVFHSQERLGRRARRRRVLSKCSGGGHDFPGALISAFSGSSLQGLMSSCLSFEPCEEYYNSKGLSSLAFFGDNGFSLFGAKNGPMTRRQRRMNRAAHSGDRL